MANMYMDVGGGRTSKPSVSKPAQSTYGTQGSNVSNANKVKAPASTYSTVGSGTTTTYNSASSNTESKKASTKEKDTPAESKKTAIKVQEPKAESKKPTIIAQDSKTDNKKPTSESKNPVASTKKPSITTVGNSGTGHVSTENSFIPSGYKDTMNNIFMTKQLSDVINYANGPQANTKSSTVATNITENKPATTKTVVTINNNSTLSNPSILPLNNYGARASDVPVAQSPPVSSISYNGLNTYTDYRKDIKLPVPATHEKKKGNPPLNSIGAHASEAPAAQSPPVSSISYNGLNIYTNYRKDVKINRGENAETKKAHTFLGIAGFTPYAGTVFDGMDAVLYASTGDKKNAVISGIVAVPVAGDLLGIIKIVKNRKYGKAVIENILGYGKKLKVAGKTENKAKNVVTALINYGDNTVKAITAKTEKLISENKKVQGIIDGLKASLPIDEVHTKRKVNSISEEAGIIDKTEKVDKIKSGSKVLEDSLKTKLDYVTSNGLELETTPGRTTTILGTYNSDTSFIIDELGNVKSIDFGPRDGGFNLLNTPDELYTSPNQFWNEYNKPWLDNAVQRNDIIKIATEPTYSNLHRVNNINGEVELTGFGREFMYLKEECNYVYDSVTKTMIPPK